MIIAGLGGDIGDAGNALTPMMFSVMVGTVNSNDAYETDELERIGAARYMPYGDKFILIFVPAAWGKYVVC
ncbi:hypothetical protein ABE142_20645 [Paenibacillus alvei]|uniref:hypothetical protein n=1 Tax=Paenibacillus alvei TaxID=44250 RepID=UPI0013DD128C|nr:hypothetical protein [Paenibacillus alvei]MBG9737352.1 hypothetical protein [Paenibacillus alvei]MBG9746105.1 hypothetical protein [Paenibacillus alvei]MCY9579115.1 hypothetical protein [Paenibacillus alvei]MCY9583542.1 hypothetical protein [Paenibacillus alvei]NEZ42132.1 hypothetical protein [Paenibacillus alvei]